MINQNYLQSSIKEFAYYKLLGEKAMAQIPDDKLGWQFNTACNSAATIVKHLWGNMLSRWVDFLTADGEKEWRERDAEFENEIITQAELMKKWDEGWAVLFDALNPLLLTSEDLSKTVYIRHQPHTVVEAINRQLAHYAYHVGQIVQLGKMVQSEQWISLSIPKGQSKNYNASKFLDPNKKIENP